MSAMVISCGLQAAAMYGFGSIDVLSELNKVDLEQIHHNINQ